MPAACCGSLVYMGLMPWLLLLTPNAFNSPLLLVPARRREARNRVRAEASSSVIVGRETTASRQQARPD